MPRGTLGFDRLEQPMPPRYDAEESRRIARGWNINKLDRAARRLKAHEDVANTNATGEETFWKDLSDISDDGWTTMRIPGEPHVMGVRLGSLECMRKILPCNANTANETLKAGPEFSQQSMARLDTDSSGHIVLNHPLARSPKFIRVTLKRGSTIVKTSELPSCLVPGHSPLKLFLRQARLSLCDQELFQTIREEARGLLRFHVQNESGKITFPIHTPSGGTKDGSNALTWYAIIEFENPDGNSSEAEQHDVSYDQDFEGTDPASQMVELLRNGLLRLYELRFRARTRPPRPMSLDHANSHNEPPKAPILRSVVEKMRHSCILQYLRGHLQLLVAAVKTTLIFPQLSDPIFESGSPGSRSKADPSVCHTTCRIQIPPVANISITVITSLAQPPFGTEYKLHVTSPHDTSLTLPSTMKLTDLPNDKATYGPHDQASTSNTIFQDLETIVVRAIALKLYIPRRESYVVEPDPREARLWRKKGEGNEWVGWMITYQPGRVMLDRLEDRKVTRQGEWRAATEYGEQNTRDIKEDVESEALGEKLED